MCKDRHVHVHAESQMYRTVPHFWSSERRLASLSDMITSRAFLLSPLATANWTTPSQYLMMSHTHRRGRWYSRRGKRARDGGYKRERKEEGKFTHCTCTCSSQGWARGLSPDCYYFYMLYLKIYIFLSCRSCEDVILF